MTDTNTVQRRGHRLDGLDDIVEGGDANAVVLGQAVAGASRCRCRGPADDQHIPATFGLGPSPFPGEGFDPPAGG